MLKKTIIAFILIYLMYAVGSLLVAYHNVYLSHAKAEEQLNKQKAEQERINKLSVPDLIEHVAPDNAEVLKKVATCESTMNPQAVNYNDGGPGKHSVGILQFQEKTFDSYAKKMGEELDYYSSHDQVKVADYMLSQNQGRQWTCFRKIYGV